MIRSITRRSALRLIGAAGATVAAASVPVRSETAASLGTLAHVKGILFGASITAGEFDKDYASSYAALYARETRIITTDLEFKLWTLRPTAIAVDYSGADRLAAFAREKDLRLRGHTLIWNDWVPPWVKALSKRDVARLLEDHVQTVVGRYRGRIHSWDVVNEPTAYWESNPGMLRGGAFYAALGEDYIARSFIAARKADPSARLILNEAWVDLDNDIGMKARAALLALVRRLRDKGVPIDGVGLESHLDASLAYDFEKYAAFVRQLSDLGLEIQITELDVDDTKLAGGIEERDRAVANLYYRYLSALLPNPAIKTVLTWQLTDLTSGIGPEALAKGRTLASPPRPLPFDRNFAPKPARDAIARAFTEAESR